MATVTPLEDRPLKDTVCLFDVDGTLSLARLHATDEMLQLLAKLRQKCAIGFVGGSDLVKQQEQLATADTSVTTMFDFCFAENGLTAYRMGSPMASTSFIKWLGEEKYQKLAKYILRYISNLEGLPAMRGTFIEFRNGMINVSPVGRNATKQERDEFEAWDKTSGCRKTLVEALRKEFADYGLTYSIGGQISFDVFPTGWDKTYCLRHIEAEPVKYTKIHFFGDKTFEGGNDYEIYTDSRTIGHSVKNPDETMAILRKEFDL